MTPRRVGLLAVVLSLVTLSALAGCGGDEESASEQWAGDVCSELTTWLTAVEETVTSLTGKGLAIERADVQAATDDVAAATDELLDGLADLGPPVTQGGAQARSELDDLGAQLQGQLDDVERELEGGEVDLVSVTTAIATAASAVSSTFESLQSLDVSDELRDAFENAGSCDSLREQVDTIGD